MERNLQNQRPPVAAQACKNHPIPRRSMLELGDLTGGRACSWDRKSRGQRQDFRRLIFCPALLRIEPHRAHRMRPHTWSLRSPFRRLTKTKELIPMDFPPEMEIAGIYPPPPPKPPLPLGKQACFNLLILWRKHGRTSQVLSTAQS